MISNPRSPVAAGQVEGPIPLFGAMQYRLARLWAYFPVVKITGATTPTQKQWSAMPAAAPITLGARVVQPTQSLQSGLGGLQTGSLRSGPLYNPDIARTGFSGAPFRPQAGYGNGY